MKSSPCHIFVPGILYDPGSADGWPIRACEWIDRYTDDDAERIEYHEGVIRLKQSHWASVLASKIAWYADRNVRLTGHSNGCALIAAAIAKLAGDLPGYRLPVVNLLCGAVEADFRTNGLGAALTAGNIDRVRVWVAGDDKAMELATLSRRLFGWFGGGYGDLGRHGPQGLTPDLEPRVPVTVAPGQGHSDLWLAGNFETTMRWIAE